MAQAGPAPTGAVNQMMQAPGGRLHVSDHPGQDPPLVLLHGFPDDAPTSGSWARCSTRCGWTAWSWSACSPLCGAPAPPPATRHRDRDTATSEQQTMCKRPSGRTKPVW